MENFRQRIFTTFINDTRKEKWLVAKPIFNHCTFLMKTYLRHLRRKPTILRGDIGLLPAKHENPFVVF